MLQRVLANVLPGAVPHELSDELIELLHVVHDSATSLSDADSHPAATRPRTASARAVNDSPPLRVG
jgi:hypothetical protein